MKRAAALRPAGLRTTWRWSHPLFAAQSSAGRSTFTSCDAWACRAPSGGGFGPSPERLETRGEVAQRRWLFNDPVPGESSRLPCDPPA